MLKKKNLLIFNKTRVFKYLKSKFLNENEKKNFFQFMFITLLYKNDLDCMNTWIIYEKYLRLMSSCMSIWSVRPSVCLPFLYYKFVIQLIALVQLKYLTLVLFFLSFLQFCIYKNCILLICTIFLGLLNLWMQYYKKFFSCTYKKWFMFFIKMPYQAGA